MSWGQSYLAKNKAPLNQNVWQELNTSETKDLTTGSAWETAEDSSLETIVLFIYLYVRLCSLLWCALPCLYVGMTAL